MEVTTDINILKLIAANQHNSIIITDEKGAISWVNEGFQQITGYSQTEVIGQNPTDLLRGALTDKKVAQKLDNAASKGKTYQAEMINYRKDGSHHWIRLEIQPFTNEDGQACYMGISQDITELKRAREIVEEHNDFLQTIIDNNPDSVYLITPELTIVAVNEACRIGMRRICDTPLEAGLNLFDLFEDEKALQMLKELQQQIQETIKAGKRLSFEVEHDVTGDYGCYQRTMTPVYKNGEIKYINVNARDITQAQLNKQELEGSRRMYQTLTENSKEMIALHELDGTYIYLSPAVKDIGGFDREEMLGKNSFDYIHPDDHEELNQQLATLASGASGTTFEYRLRMPNGSYRWMESSATLVKDESGKPRHIRSSTVDITERRSMQRHLQFQSNMIHSVRDSVVAVDKKGNIVYWNSGSEKIFGLSRESMMGQHITKLYKNFLPENIYDLYPNLKGGIFEKNWNYISDEGKNVWVHSKSKPLIDKEEKVIGTLTISEDITDSRRIEMLMKLTNSITEVGGWEASPESQQFYLTQGVYDIFGIPNTTQMTLEYGLSFFHDDDRQRVATIMENAISKGTTVDFEARLIAADGTEKWVHCKGFSEKRNGKIISSYGSIQDITQNKHRELILQESEERFRKITEAAPIGIYLADKGEDVIWVNKAMERLGEISSEAFLGKGFTDFIHPDDVERVIAEYDEFIKTRIGNPINYRFITKSGEIRFIESVSAAIVNDKNEVEYTVGSITDITDKLEYERKLSQMNEELEAQVQQRTKELEDSNQELETFNFMMTHDLKTPLRSASIFTQMLERKSAVLDKEQQQYLSNIQYSLDESFNIIHDLLEYAKLRKGQLQLKRLNLAALMRAHFEDLKKTQEDKGAKLEIDKLPELEVDLTLIDHVIGNLFANAFKYQHKQRSLEMKVALIPTDEPGHVCIQIKDNGMGFNNKHAQNMFDPFRRLVARSHSGGSGLGLAICKRIVERHNGRIWAEGKEGTGASFFISLPTPEAT